MLVGLPGSGKSTWAERQGIVVLSSDAVRAMLTGDAANQSVNGQVFATLRDQVTMRMNAEEETTILDATSLTPKERKGWVTLAESLGGEAEAVFFDTPVAVCKERNSTRARVVPDDVMERFAAKLVPPTTEEGFKKVTVVRP